MCMSFDKSLSLHNIPFVFVYIDLYLVIPRKITTRQIRP